MVLSCYDIHAWVVIHFLVRIQLCQEVGSDAQVMPGHIPLFDEFLIMLPPANSSVMVLIVFAQLEAEHFAGHFLDNFILRAKDVHHEPRVRIFVA
jgi:hypothetical protein